MQLLQDSYMSEAVTLIMHLLELTHRSESDNCK